MWMSAVIGEQWPFKVGAVFSDFAAAQRVAESLAEGSHERHSRVDLIEPGDPKMTNKLEPETVGVRRTLVRSHVVMGIAGILGGLLLVLILSLLGVEAVSANIGYASMALGFVGGMIGMMAGGLVSIRPDHDHLINEARDACEHGQWVVLVHTQQKSEEDRVRDVLKQYSDDVVSTF